MAIGTDIFAQYQIELIYKTYPKISNIHVEFPYYGVEPIKYNGPVSTGIFGTQRGDDRYEYPPIVRWKVGDKSFVYVARPGFRIEKLESVFMTTEYTLPHYNDENAVLFRLFEMSSEGNSVEDLNEYLESIGY